jgi:hypothetical protein
MSGPCSSSPLSGCTDSQTLISLDSYTEMVTLKLGELVVKKGQIVTDITNCRNAINLLWHDVLEKLETYKDNRSDCCERLNELLDEINTELEDKTNLPHPVTPTTTEEPVFPTTEEPVATTTEEPTPTTTEGPVYNHGLFNYEDDSDFLCLEENVMTLYYQGIVQTGTVLFTDQGTTPFNLGDYVKRAGAVVKFSCNGFGVITQLAELCE